MVTVRFVGGMKKSFQLDQMELSVENIPLEKLISLLLEKKPKNTPDFDTNNVLIAINGADSSAMEGNSTIIKKNDLISIIPIIHGGSGKKLFFNVGTKNVLVIELKGNKKIDVTFLENLRKEFPHVNLQAISSKFILNSYHLKNLLGISIKSKREKILLANKLETDILMRFALTNQISEAIKKVGIKPNSNIVLIAIGKKPDLEKIYKNLKFFTIPLFSKNNSSFLIKNFKISKNQIDSVSSKKPLEDILIEKAAVLL